MKWVGWGWRGGVEQGWVLERSDKYVPASHRTPLLSFIVHSIAQSLHSLSYLGSSTNKLSSPVCHFYTLGYPRDAAALWSGVAKFLPSLPHQTR